MRTSKMLIPTLREVPAEAEIASHKLLLRAGMIARLASGIYSFLPLGYRTFRKIEGIIREEMDRAGAQELMMAAILPAEAYQASGRWDAFGPEMFKLKDRHGRDFCLGPTHEEIFAEVAKNTIRSYKSLPSVLYQIQTKYRDERRPRFGLMRSREFVMKDAYSFGKDDHDLDISYDSMHDAYCRIFDRLGLDYIIVDADTGAMGGSGSQEFMVKSDVGEDVIVFCESCGYAANSEKAKCIIRDKDSASNDYKAMEKIATPNMKTIDEVTEFLDCREEELVKTLLYRADDKIVAALIRGDRDLNEVKFQNYLGCVELEMADPHTVVELTGSDVGFAGPIGLDVDLIVDLEVAQMQNFVVGANETGYHMINVNIDRDFKPTIIKDIRTIAEGDMCPQCGESIKIEHGIEVGHIFKLGTKYSKSAGAVYLDDNGKEQLMVMGSYGIGLARTLAAIVEQNNDDDGIIWPISVAPYHVVVVPINTGEGPQMENAEKIYNELLDAGIEVMLDDRNERPGVRFKDADLIGIPLRITVGRGISQGIVEYKRRDSDEVEELEVSEAIKQVKNQVFTSK
ncbi:MAG TPA: proline--tRNA ligase [Clostridia bacterium]|nr:proline--tRNA ligase [Clostridia bacterium]